MITFLKQNNKLITTLGSGIAILKNNIENITDKGERIYLSNTIKARFKKFGITGNSKQTTREESNLYDKSKNTNSKGVDSNGEEYDTSGWTLTDYISISAENKLLKYSGLTAVGNKPHSAFYDSNKNFISSFKQATGENTIEIPQNASFVRFTLEIASGDVNTFNVSYVAMPSTEMQSEIKTVKGSANVTVCNKNLFDNEFEIGIIDAENGKNGSFPNSKYIRTKNYIRIKSNTQYTITNPVKNNARKTRFYDKNKNYIGYLAKSGGFLALTTDTQTKCKGTTPDNAYYMRFELDFNDEQTGQDVIDGKYKYQLELGNATDYIAHEEQNFTIDVQQEMLEDDCFDLDNEEEVHNIEKIILNGTEENWKQSSLQIDGYVGFFLENKLNAIGQNKITKCENLKVMTYNDWDKLVAKEFIESTNKTIGIRIKKDRLTENTLNGFKAFLQSNNITFYYKLAEPKKLQFTEEQKTIAKQIRETIHSYKDGTHIFSTDEISPVFDVIAYTRK